MSSADAGVSFHTNLPNNYGDFHVGFYNGESYNHAETNNVRRPSSSAARCGRSATGKPEARGLRLTGFWTNDAPINDGRRDRALFELTYEHKYFTFGYDYLDAE